jgi:hypothetical protein
MNEEAARALNELMAGQQKIYVTAKEVNAAIGLLRDKADKAENELAAFKTEWSERFGFLAVENPRDSIESIDEALWGNIYCPRNLVLLIVFPLILDAFATVGGLYITLTLFPELKLGTSS